MIFLLIAAVLQDSPPNYIGWWEIWKSKNDPVCVLSAQYQNNEYLGVQYDAATKMTRIIFTEKNATSLNEGDKRKVDIYFGSEKAVDTGWRDTEVAAFIGAKHGLRMLISENLTAEFLEDFARSNAVVIWYGKTKIAAYRLDNSAKAIAALRICSMRAAGLNPLDPFLR